MVKLSIPSYHARGRFNDSHYHLARDWYAREQATIAEIARRLKSNRATVSYWLKRPRPPSETVWTPPKADAKKIAKRRKLVDVLATTRVKETRVNHTPKRKARRERVVYRKPYGSPAKIARKINLDHPELRCSKSTVMRDLKANGRRARVGKKGHRLSDSAKARRVEFARRLLQLKEQLNIGFSDEKWFDSDDGREWHWVRPGERVPTRETESYGPRLMVWGVIARGYRLLVRVPPSITGKGAVKINEEVYCKLIEPVLRHLVRRKIVFQQDNAPSHTGAVNRGFFKRRKVQLLAGWPATSPDLSPIETLWAILQRRVTDRGPFGEDELWKFVEEEFYKVEESTIEGLLDEFEPRLRACVKAKGEFVSQRDVKAFK